MSSRACSKPKLGVNWSRYVARNGGLCTTAEQRERAAFDGHVRAGHEALAVQAARREHDLPPRPEATRGQAERDVLEVGVEEEQERVVTHLVATPRLGVQLVAVEEDADRARLDVVPVAAG